MPLSTTAAASKDATTRATMTHQHFAEIARIIRTANVMTYAELARMQTHFANELQSTNPRFDRARFLAACNANSEKTNDPPNGAEC